MFCVPTIFSIDIENYIYMQNKHAQLKAQYTDTINLREMAWCLRRCPPSLAPLEAKPLTLL